MNDLISRKAMLERLEQWNTSDDTDKALYNFAKNRAIEQPTVDRWIPCSERKPEESGSYLISGVWGSGKIAVCDCDFSVNDGYFRTAWNFDVLAWMPLPEPYEAGDQE